MSELPEPRSFDAASAQVTTTTSGTGAHLALVHMGSQQQEKFLAWAEHELLPALRELG
jgi:UDP-N-acetyl-D-mannosaminuronic acid transferase (WecB/TagA/CpsF family)